MSPEVARRLAQLLRRQSRALERVAAELDRHAEHQGDHDAT
ncbi:MAG: hypothetical protein ABI766_10370 [Gemmatimonadales bacterium]